MSLKNMLTTSLSAFAITITRSFAIDNAALDPSTSKMMEFHHLMKHEDPKIKEIRHVSTANEMGLLFLGVEEVE